MNIKATISQAEFAARREQLMAKMGANSIAIIAAAPEQIRNRDVHYPYRQDSDFLYLTGFNEPDAVAVLMPGREAGEFIMFCRERDPAREIWDGLRAGPDGARRDFGAQEAATIGEFPGALAKLLAGCDRLYYSFGQQPAMDQKIFAALNSVSEQSRRGLKAPGEITVLDDVLHAMRLFKSPAEIDAMRHAAQTSARAHAAAMAVCQSGMPEYQIAAQLHYEFARDGMTPAYPSIVGGGANACILHYIENSAVLNDGDMLLIDAGAEYRGYAADITRSFPVNGKFSDAQREIYQVVLDAQLAAIDAVRVGNDYNAPHRAAVKHLCQGMLDLGILQGGLDAVIESETYRDFYMHGTGHWLGMDVHDVGDYKQQGEWRMLEPGMTVTIEPGLYIRAGREDVDERFWNIGIRIEDDVLVSEEGPDVLSRDVPKTITEIESLMRSGR